MKNRFVKRIPLNLTSSLKIIIAMDRFSELMQRIFSLNVVICYSDKELNVLIYGLLFSPFSAIIYRSYKLFENGLVWPTLYMYIQVAQCTLWTVALVVVLVKLIMTGNATTGKGLKFVKLRRHSVSLTVCLFCVKMNPIVNSKAILVIFFKQISELLLGSLKAWYKFMKFVLVSVQASTKEADDVTVSRWCRCDKLARETNEIDATCFGGLDDIDYSRLLFLKRTIARKIVKEIAMATNDG